MASRYTSLIAASRSAFGPATSEKIGSSGPTRAASLVSLPLSIINACRIDGLWSRRSSRAPRSVCPNTRRKWPTGAGEAIRIELVNCGLSSTTVLTSLVVYRIRVPGFIIPPFIIISASISSADLAVILSMSKPSLFLRAFLKSTSMPRSRSKPPVGAIFCMAAIASGFSLPGLAKSSLMPAGTWT